MSLCDSRVFRDDVNSCSNNSAYVGKKEKYVCRERLARTNYLSTTLALRGFNFLRNLVLISHFLPIDDDMADIPDINMTGPATSSYEDEDEDEIEYTWISKHLDSPGSEFLVEIPEDYIDDDFNLTGLSSLVPHYTEALEMILDDEPDSLSIADTIVYDRSAKLLYGLIHARFILTTQGLELMYQKCMEGQFGFCPRMLCNNTRLLPVGKYDLPGYDTLRFYCPRCDDIYIDSGIKSKLDGAFFGTSFPGVFLKQYPGVETDSKKELAPPFKLSLFGFGINEMSKCGPRMKWLRALPEKEIDLEYYSELDSSDSDKEKDISKSNLSKEELNHDGDENASTIVSASNHPGDSIVIE